MAKLTILDPSSPYRVPLRHCAFGIMTKAPRAGEVKTRLTPPLTAEEAAQINICFLRDLSRSISVACEQTPARGIGVYTPVGCEEVYDEVLPHSFLLLSQRGQSFAERLIFAAKDLFQIGFESACLINSDSPTIPASNFAEAANELARPGDRIVLGPSDDGGYYLIGLKKLHLRLFEEINWSTDVVFEQTRQRAAEIGIEVHDLPPGLDIDDRAALRRLCDELLSGGASADVAPSTRKFLGEIIEREGRQRIWPV